MRPTELVSRPEDWATTTVGKSIEIKRGISWSKDQEHEHAATGRVPVIRIGNVQNRLELDDLMYLSGIDHETKVAKRVEKGWTILVGSNGNRARIGNAVLYRDEAELLFASFLVGAKPNACSGVDPAYFYHWLSSEKVQAYLSASAEGTTGLTNLSHNFLKNMTIPIPPIEEQAAIARILDAVDTALKRTRDTAERARDAFLSSVTELLDRGIGNNGKLRDPIENASDFTVTPLGRLPRNWRISTVGDEFEVRSGFTINSDRRPRLQKRRYLRVANVQRDFLNLSDVHELEAKEDEFLPRILAPDDLVIVEGHADKMEIGRCARVTEKASGMTFQNHLFRLRTKGEITPGFACMWLNSIYARRFWNARSATSSGLNTINQRALKQLVLPVPSEREQRAVVSIGDQYRRYRDSVALKRLRLEELKSSLMHELLTGKVRVGGIAEARAS